MPTLSEALISCSRFCAGATAAARRGRAAPGPRRMALALSGLCLGLLCLPASAGLFDQSGNRGAFLPSEQAFVLDAVALDREHIEARWLIAPGYYLYRHRLDVIGSAGTALHWQAPAGQPYQDEHFGAVEIYREVLSLPLRIDAGQAESITLQFQYQGCADAGLCYPPVKREVTVELPARP